MSAQTAIETILVDFNRHVMECACDDANPNHICPDTTRLNPILPIVHSLQAQLDEARKVLKTLYEKFEWFTEEETRPEMIAALAVLRYAALDHPKA